MSSALLNDPVDQIILSLYQASREEPVERFQGQAFALLETLIPCTSGFWSRAGVENGNVRLYNSFEHRIPDGLGAAWARLEEHDVIGKHTVAAMGTTINSVARELITDPDVMSIIVDGYGLEHLLSTCLVDPLTSLISVVALIRDAGASGFSEAERKLKQRIMPHLIEAYSANRTLHMMAARVIDAPTGFATAGCDEHGLIEVVSKDFVELIRLEWPNWQGPKLPPSLNAAQGKNGTIFRGAAIVVIVEFVNTMIWLRARRKLSADDLSPRETEVARLSAAGLSNKEIARQLAISPHTVRNQLASVYAKLDVRTRTGLARRIGEISS